MNPASQMMIYAFAYVYIWVITTIYYIFIYIYIYIFRDDKTNKSTKCTTRSCGPGCDFCRYYSLSWLWTTNYKWDAHSCNNCSNYNNKHVWQFDKALGRKASKQDATCSISCVANASPLKHFLWNPLESHLGFIQRRTCLVIELPRRNAQMVS